MGRFWRAHVPFKFKFTVFAAVVFSPGLSGLKGFARSQAAVAEIHRVWIALLRKLFGKAATRVINDKWCSISNAELLKKPN